MPPRWLVPFLRVRLEFKLVVANASVLLGSLWVWSFVHAELAPLGPWRTAGLIGIILAVSATLNTGLVLLALRPVFDLERTAARVHAGDWSARTNPTPITDPAIDRLRETFDGFLDWAQERDATALMRSKAVVRVEERERGRLSGEMYQETAQSLASLLLQLRLVERLASEGRATDETSGAVGDAVRDVLEGIRSIARRLRPPELDELGVRSAIDAHVRRLRDGDDVPRLTVFGDFDEDRLDPDRGLLIFRVVQEALDNALRHARADTIEVLLRSDDTSVVVQITDDGIGFDPDRASSTGEGLGIPSMVERARVGSGSLTVDSAPGRGTCITLRLPWDTATSELHPDPLAHTVRL